MTNCVNRINLKKMGILFCLAICTLSCFSQREKLSFNKGWKFYKGDITFSDLIGHKETVSNAKAGIAFGAAAQEYNDFNWKDITIPHDWSPEDGYDSTKNVSQGYSKRGIGWYRRHFKLNAADKGKNIEIQFDGIATFATVWFNGTVVHRNWCGYTSFYIDITSMAKYGDEENVIAIRVDANAMEGWWYEGAGIYRNSWLIKRSPTHIITDGVFANPVLVKNQWTIPIEVMVDNHGKKTETVTVESKLYNNKKTLIASAQQQVSVNLFVPKKATYSIVVNKPNLWSIENPQVYTVVTSIKQNNKIVDEVTTNCGFRTILFTKDSGFYLNNKPVKLQGVCNHQDHAGIGVAMTNSMWLFKLKKLKEMGVNAYRCSHNPPPTELLDMCDSMGIMVMDENRNFNVSPEYVRQLEWLVKRDRNRPSIILWSVFNEEPMQGTEQGYEMVRRMSAIVKQLDTSRPVTAAMNGGFFAEKNVSQAVDVVGFNYQIGSYDRFHKENPNMLLTSSENGSAYQVRGEYKTDKNRNTFNNYDTEAAQWGATHRKNWKAIVDRPYLAGGFYWTAFDYRGEPTPHTWPSASSFFGIMDLCGFPKTAYYIYQAQWRKDTNIMQLVPHWNWSTDTIGKPIKVMAVSNADSVQLVLNNKPISTQKALSNEMNTWQVPYHPGKLEAIGFKNGKAISKHTVETTGVPVAVQLVSDRNFMTNDGTDAMPITAIVVDANGREIPTAQHLIEFSLSNNAEIIGLGNGDPNSHEAEKGNKRHLFNGLAQVIIQAKENTNGKIQLTASSKGLKSFTLDIPLQQVPPIAYVPTLASSISLIAWRMSPTSATKPNPLVSISDNDMNTWINVKSNETNYFPNDVFALYNTELKLKNNTEKWKLQFKKLTGKVEIWIDNKLAYKKESFGAENIELPISPNSNNLKITLLVEAEQGKRAGLGGTVTLEPVQ
jgi:beta-galactosidase